MARPTHRQAPKLPLTPTVASAYASVFRLLPLAVWRGWPWLLVLFAVDFLIAWQTPSPGALAGPSAKPGLAAMLAGHLVLQGWLDTLIATPFYIEWYRIQLRSDDPPAQTPPYSADIAFGFAVRAFALGQVLATPFLVGFVMATTLPADETHAALPAQDYSEFFLIGAIVLALSLIVWLPALIVAARLSLVFPALAMEDDGAGLAAAWRLTRGNTGRMFGGLILATLPLLVTILVLARTAVAEEALAPAIPSALFDAGTSVAITIIGVVATSFLAHAYVFFNRAGDAAIVVPVADPASRPEATRHRLA